MKSLKGQIKLYESDEGKKNHFKFELTDNDINFLKNDDKICNDALNLIRSQKSKICK